MRWRGVGCADLAVATHDLDRRRALLLLIAIFILGIHVCNATNYAL